MCISSSVRVVLIFFLFLFLFVLHTSKNLNFCLERLEKHLQLYTDGGFCKTAYETCTVHVTRNEFYLIYVSVF